MGNKLCKKKTEPVDNAKSPTPFDRIINRLHLRPNSWKSDSHLNQKQVNGDPMNGDISKTQSISKSSDWTEVDLEVPDKEAIHLPNPKLSLIFNNNGTPTPPPRKHKKGLREKLEAVAKTSLQAFQSKKPVEEAPCVKKTITATCPMDDHDCAIHNRDHKHEIKRNDSRQQERRTPPLSWKLSNKESKRRKNLSVISLPNYNELKLTVATFDDIDKKPDSAKGSLTSLPNETKKLTAAASTGRLETYMTRCRSIGSLLPQQLLEKLRARKAPTDADSDDSFGGLEEWDLRIIEHYNPKDASLPRPRKSPKNDAAAAAADVLANIESLIVYEEAAPAVPARRQNSPVRKINKEAVGAVVERRSQEVPTDLLPEPKQPAQSAGGGSGAAEHSSLMKILEEFSIKDKQNEDANKANNGTCTSLTPSLDEFEKNMTSIEDFINAEKRHSKKDSPVTKFGKFETAQT